MQKIFNALLTAFIIQFFYKQYFTKNITQMITDI